MTKTKWRNPYENENTTFPDRNKPGVYLIQEGEKIVYIGASSTDVYKTLYRHFQSWHDRKQVRVTYNEQIRWNKDRYKVRVIYCTREQADTLEIKLILKHNPRDNAEKYNDYLFNPKTKEINKKTDDNGEYIAPF